MNNNIKEVSYRFRYDSALDSMLVNNSIKEISDRFRYDPALDGWRAVSIALVVISHAGFGNIVPGGFGVTIFFFISGYLITSLLLTEWYHSGHVSLTSFYLRRFWRLAPPLFVYILLSVLTIFYINGIFPFNEMLASLLYFANYYQLFWGFEELGPNHASSPLKILWSLAIEEHYYFLLAPIFVFAFRRSQLLISMIFVLCIAPLVWRCSLVFVKPTDWLNSGYTYEATECRIDSIAWGVLLAWLTVTKGKKLVALIFDHSIVILFSLAILLFCLLYRDNAFRESLRYSLQGVALMSIFFTSLYGRWSNISRYILEAKPFVWLGKISYSLYLYHWLARDFADVLSEVEHSYVWHQMYWVLTFLLASASYYLVERSMLKIRKRFGSRAN